MQHCIKQYLNWWSVAWVCAALVLIGFMSWASITLDNQHDADREAKRK